MAALLSLMVSCHSAPKARRYELKGEVLSVDTRGQEAVIRHEEIPGFMKAMTMGYRVKDEADLAKLRPGQRIRADLVVTEDSSWIENIRVDSSGGPEQMAKASEFHMPQAGESVPNFELIDQDGRRFKLSARYPALVTFIYTRCPLPDYCPRMNTNFQAVASKLRDTSAGNGLRLITISFDPEHDTPAVLKRYRDQWATTPEAKQRWTFAVPAKQDMPELLHFFAMTAVPEQGIITHSLSTTLISRSGRVEAWWHGNDWTAVDVQQALSQAGD
jgi:protein SCO1/2